MRRRISFSSKAGKRLHNTRISIQAAGSEETNSADMVLPGITHAMYHWRSSCVDWPEGGAVVENISMPDSSIQLLGNAVHAGAVWPEAVQAELGRRFWPQGSWPEGAGRPAGPPGLGVPA